MRGMSRVGIWNWEGLASEGQAPRTGRGKVSRTRKNLTGEG